MQSKSTTCPEQRRPRTAPPDVLGLIHRARKISEDRLPDVLLSDGWEGVPHTSMLRDIKELGRAPKPQQLTRQFLQTLYGPHFSQLQSPACLDVRGKLEGGTIDFRKFYESPEALLEDMASWNMARNYWIGVALRKDNQGGRKENLLLLTTAFVDVDAGLAGHRGTIRYQDKAEALAAIEAFHLRPTMLVCSGGGYQAYWTFCEPVRLTSETIPHLEGINRALALALGGDTAATDAARILRLPGTFNMKIAGNPRPVTIVWCESGLVYTLEDFEGIVSSTVPIVHGDLLPPEEEKGSGDYSAYAQAALARELTELAGATEGTRNSHPSPWVN
jgi:hypothetical protein